jgi:hypothetical protein
MCNNIGTAVTSQNFIKVMWLQMAFPSIIQYTFLFIVLVPSVDTMQFTPLFSELTQKDFENYGNAVFSTTPKKCFSFTQSTAFHNGHMTYPRKQTTMSDAKSWH